MRYVQIRLHGETLSDERKRQLMQAIEYAFNNITGNSDVPVCVSIDEVPRDNWGVLGAKPVGQAPVQEGPAGEQDKPAEPKLTVLGSFAYKGGAGFGDTGIVAHLAGRPGSAYQNPAEAGLIAVTSSTLMHDSMPASAIVGNEVVRCCTKPLPNSWFEVDFRQYRVAPTHYSLRHYASWDVEALRSWVLEGSTDGLGWYVLSRIENDDSLDKRGDTQTWPVDNHFAGVFVRYLRLTQKGPNSNNHHYLALSGLEVHGQLAKMSQGVQLMAMDAAGTNGLAVRQVLTREVLERLAKTKRL